MLIYLSDGDHLLMAEEEKKLISPKDYADLKRKNQQLSIENEMLKKSTGGVPFRCVCCAVGAAHA